MKAKSKGRRQSKGRSPGNRRRVLDPEMALVPLSCPDCAGVLSVKQEGPAAQHLYVCQIDHRHSMTSLYGAMEVRLENTLWTASVIMKQLETVYENLSAKGLRPSDSADKQITRRLREVQNHRAAIQALIRETHVIECTDDKA